LGEEVLVVYNLEELRLLRQPPWLKTKLAMMQKIALVKPLQLGRG
jgi:hypothetical protein